MYVTNNKSYDSLCIDMHHLASTLCDTVMSAVQESNMQIMIDANC